MRDLPIDISPKEIEDTLKLENDRLVVAQVSYTALHYIVSQALTHSV